MAKETINNKASGETGGTARTKLNAMFTELYAYITSSTAAIALKVTANSAITGGTKTKLTYDTKGLVTSATDATCDDILDGTNYHLVTTAQKVIIGNTSGINTGDATSLGLHAKADAAGAADTAVTLAAGADRTKLDGIATGATSNTKAAFGDINTGTDDAKFATSLAIEGSRLVKGPATLTQEQLCSFDSTNVNKVKESKIYRVGDNYGVGAINPLSLFEIGGSFGLKSRTLDGSDTLDATDCIVICSVNSITVSLPESSTCEGRIYIIKGNKNTVATTDEITISAFGSEKIDEDLEYTLASAYACVIIYATATGWIIISEKN